MYVRFIVCEPGIRPARGIFRPETTIDWHFQPAWLQEQFDEHRNWFNEHLPVPRKRRKLNAGFCWFRPKAREHIARAREMARLIAETGVATAQIQTFRPGQILYRDDYQIVAKPGDGTPISA
jgi:hypothetical protein